MRPRRTVPAPRPRASEHECDATFAGGRALIKPDVHLTRPEHPVLEYPIVGPGARWPHKQASLFERHYRKQPILPFAGVFFAPQKHQIAQRVDYDVGVLYLRCTGRRSSKRLELCYGAAARVCLINLSGRLAVRVDLDARVGVQVGV